MGTLNIAVPHPTQDVLLKQYELHMELYKQYLELVLKFNIFYYAVTGAVLSFYFTNNADVGAPRYLLLLFPMLMSLGFGVFFIWAAGLVKYIRADVMVIVQALGLQVFPEMRVLAVVLRLSGGLFIAVALGLLALICHVMHR